MMALNTLFNWAGCQCILNLLKHHWYSRTILLETLLQFHFCSRHFQEGSLNGVGTKAGKQVARSCIRNILWFESKRFSIGCNTTIENEVQGVDYPTEWNVKTISTAKTKFTSHLQASLVISVILRTAFYAVVFNTYWLRLRNSGSFFPKMFHMSMYDSILKWAGSGDGREGGKNVVINLCSRFSSISDTLPKLLS